MTRLLLDTHVFIWWTEANSSVKSLWVDEILDESNSVYVSAISALEIDTKRRLNKLDFDGSVRDAVAEYGFEQLSVTLDHASAAGRLQWDHRDPFDRVLVAQAIENDMLLVSADKAIVSAPGVRVL
jgi:PIN domain nuclease of toxin-antitoxin system